MAINLVKKTDIVTTPRKAPVSTANAGNGGMNVEPSDKSKGALYLFWSMVTISVVLVGGFTIHCITNIPFFFTSFENFISYILMVIALVIFSFVVPFSIYCLFSRFFTEEGRKAAKKAQQELEEYRAHISNHYDMDDDEPECHANRKCRKYWEEREFTESIDSYYDSREGVMKRRGYFEVKDTPSRCRNCSFYDDYEDCCSYDWDEDGYVD